MSPAPIALFAFKRPEHTERTLRALALNPGFAASPLHVFCDAARRPDEEDAVARTRRVVREWPHADKHVDEAAANRGLARSIIAGVSRLCASHGRVIVVEDDLVVAPVFLDYMNRALDRYADEPRVMQVSGHMFPLPVNGPTDATFLPFITSWGWATWQRAWALFDAESRQYARLAGDRGLRARFDLGGAYPYFAMLQRQLEGKIDSWAIRWYLSVFMAEGLVLYPRRTLVSNEGLDGSGTHGANEASGMSALELPNEPLDDLPAVALDAACFDDVTRWLRNHTSLRNRLRRRIRARFGLARFAGA